MNSQKWEARIRNRINKRLAQFLCFRPEYVIFAAKGYDPSLGSLTEHARYAVAVKTSAVDYISRKGEVECSFYKPSIATSCCGFNVSSRDYFTSESSNLSYQGFCQAREIYDSCVGDPQTSYSGHMRLSLLDTCGREDRSLNSVVNRSGM
jgi:hypothetical protein